MTAKQRFEAFCKAEPLADMCQALEDARDAARQGDCAVKSDAYWRLALRAAELGVEIRKADDCAFANAVQNELHTWLVAGRKA